MNKLEIYEELVNELWEAVEMNQCTMINNDIIKKILARYEDKILFAEVDVLLDEFLYEMIDYSNTEIENHLFYVKDHFNFESMYDFTARLGSYSRKWEEFFRTHWDNIPKVFNYCYRCVTDYLAFYSPLPFDELTSGEGE